MDTFLGILVLIMIAIYWYAGDWANYYCKYHFFNVRAEIYGNTGDYIVQRIIWATLLGWLTIPVALLHKNYKGGSN